MTRIQLCSIIRFLNSLHITISEKALTVPSRKALQNGDLVSIPNANKRIFFAFCSELTFSDTRSLIGPDLTREMMTFENEAESVYSADEADGGPMSASPRK